MSASAGRVLIIPRGDYNPTTTYNMLDMVYYGGKSYICKQTSTGNVPTNTVYWQIMLDGASEFSALSDVELNNLQDGDGIYYDGTAQKWKNTTPTSIAITSPPATTEYSDGDILDLTGMVVTAYYAGGSSRNITGECTFSPANGATLTTANTSVTVTWRTFTATQAITVTAKIYGVEWDGSSSPALTRTDASADFVDPVPYDYNNSTGGSSPFDSIYPWSEMTVVEDAEAGTLVKIPKFYCKLDVSNGFKLQICKNKVDNTWYCSPAHMDRGDGQGERDVVYIGKYHSNSTDWKSRTGYTPKVSIARNAARSNISSLGTTIWQSDLLMRVTIWMLYIVEFANWNSQDKFNIGGWNNSSVKSTGATDVISYHSGYRYSTGINNRTKYRNIEDLWGNGGDFIDGIYRDINGTHVIKNPADFSDSTGGVISGFPALSAGNITSFAQMTTEGYEGIFFPKTTSGTTYTTHVCDRATVNLSDVSFYTGMYGAVTSDSDRSYNGLFFIQTGQSGMNNTGITCRLMKLPNAS